MYSKSFLLLILSVCCPCLSHYHESFFRERSDWKESHKSIGRTMFSVLDDSFNVGKLFVIGTHNSMTYTTKVLYLQCQGMTLYDQLNFGIRFVDIRLRSTSNKFACHHGSVFLGRMFGDVLKETLQFLRENPREAVFMELQEEYESDNSDKTICEILSEYMTTYGRSNFIITETNLQNLRLSEIRGKIVLIGQRNFDNCFNMMTLNICRQQNDFELKTTWDLYDKWIAVRDHIDDAITSSKKYPCYINYLSGSASNGLVYPVFVASGHMVEYSTDGSRAPTMFVDPISPNKYPDFPRVDCFLGMCTIAFEGTNTLITDKRLYKNDKVNRDLLKINSLYILMADYFGPKLIEAAYELNRIRSREEYEAIKKP